MTIWTYTDSTETVVTTINADGSQSSALVNSPQVQAWIDAGNTPAPWETFAESQAVQLALIESGCSAQIARGFSSTALGAPYTYPLDLNSQSNMQAAVMRMNIPQPAPPATINFMCADANGIWLRRPHNAAQLLQAAIDGMAYIVAVLAKKDALTVQVNNATTIGEVQAIAWAYP